MLYVEICISLGSVFGCRLFYFFDLYLQYLFDRKFWLVGKQFGISVNSLIVVSFFQKNTLFHHIYCTWRITICDVVCALQLITRILHRVVLFFVAIAVYDLRILQLAWSNYVTAVIQLGQLAPQPVALKRCTHLFICITLEHCLVWSNLWNFCSAITSIAIWLLIFYSVCSEPGCWTTQSG